MKFDCILQVIGEGLDNDLQCIEGRRRQKLVKVFPEFFLGNASATDIKEYQVVQYLDPVKEQRSCREKLLSVRHSYHYIMHVCAFG
jgi:hypothetical protein